MENMGAVMPSFWNGKRVFLTGHTGFKGSWLSVWLHRMGAEVMGYALEPPTNPSMYELCLKGNSIRSIIGDIRDAERLKQAVLDFKPEIVIHMAAQPLVRESYRTPIETYTTNVMGTVHFLEAVRYCPGIRAVLNVTTDKCYENKEWLWGYRETESLGGYDPYSNSKACSELVTSSYRDSYFHPTRYAEHRVAIATARAGNVIGGGDWAVDRLVPDTIKSLLNREAIIIRNPAAIRPWQHVLEPISGYLVLLQRLYQNGHEFSEAWNFGPKDEDAKPVQWVVSKLRDYWGGQAFIEVKTPDQPFHEAHYLKLDCSKAKSRLGWSPRWSLEEALKKVYEWSIAYHRSENMLDITLQQIEDFCRQ